MRYLFVLAALLCAAFVYAAEPPAIREEPPMLRDCGCDVCECPDGVCPGCTVKIGADIIYNASHSCPKCGTFANIVERELAGGVHTHRCGNCSTEWWHRDPGETQYVAAPPANPFALPGCANGNCPPSIRYSAPSTSRTYSATTTRSTSSSGSGRVKFFDGTGWYPGKLIGAVFGGCR